MSRKHYKCIKVVCSQAMQLFSQAKYGGRILTGSPSSSQITGGTNVVIVTLAYCNNSDNNSGNLYKTHATVNHRSTAKVVALWSHLQGAPKTILQKNFSVSAVADF